MDNTILDKNDIKTYKKKDILDLYKILIIECKKRNIKEIKTNIKKDLTEREKHLIKILIHEEIKTFKNSNNLLCIEYLNIREKLL